MSARERAPSADSGGSPRQRPLNVLFLMESMEVAGAEQLVLSIVRRIDRTRFQPVVGCLTVPGPLADEVRAAGVELVALGKRPGLDVRILGRLRRLLREHRVDILHTHVWPADVWGRIAARTVRVPIVITTEHSVCIWKTWRHLAVDRFLARWSTSVVCVSHAVFEFYRGRAGIGSPPLRCIHNGIDAAPFLDAIDVARERSALAEEANRTVVTAVGRLIREKGHGVFFEAVSRVRRAHPSVVGWVVGEGPLRGDLEARARDLGLLPDGMRFLGERRDVPLLLKASDAFVLPTVVREGLSLSILEAMAAGLPVIVTDVGGNREIVEDGKNGLLVPPGDSQGLADAIERIVAAPAQAREWGRKAREDVLAHFTLDRMVREYEELYESSARAKGLL